MNYFPALVAINNTPIIFDEEMKKFRRITPREAANLQSFKEEFDLSVNSGIYKQLGNSVNVEIIKRLAIKLFAFEKKGGNPNGVTESAKNSRNHYRTPWLAKCTCGKCNRILSRLYQKCGIQRNLSHMARRSNSRQYLCADYLCAESGL